MSFDVFLGHPYMTALLPPPGADASSSTTTADPTSGRFQATSVLDAVHPLPRNASVSLSAAMTLPSGSSTVSVTYKLAIGHFTSVVLIPGPGYVAATCGVDFVVTRRPPGGSINVKTLGSLVLAHSWVVLVAPIGDLGTVPEVVMNLPFTLNLRDMGAPGGTTVAGEVWQFTIRPWAETGGSGFLIPTATAQVNGAVYGFRVIGN